MYTLYTRLYGRYSAAIEVLDAPSFDNLAHITISSTSGSIYLSRHEVKLLRRALKAWLRDTK